MAHLVTEKTVSRIKLSGADRTLVIINGILLFLFTIIELYPLIFVLSASISDPDAVANGEMILWPVGLDLGGYKFIFDYKAIWSGYANTIFYTVLGTLVNLFLTLPAGYALSRRDLKFRGIFMVFFMITMYFSGGMIPTFLIVKQLGLYNTRMAMLLITGVSTYNLIVCRTFFANTIPWELHEAARIDGANDFRTFARIVLPLSSPIIVVMILYYAVGHWNSYFNALIYLNDKDKWPLQLQLRKILILGEFMKEAIAQGTGNEDYDAMLKQIDQINMIKYGIIVVASLPMLIVFPFLQKYFSQGIMIGSVKG